MSSPWPLRRVISKEVPGQGPAHYHLSYVAPISKFARAGGLGYTVNSGNFVSH
jgi:hypothetical protein